MGGEIRSLWVSLKARTAVFERRMKRSRMQLKRFKSAIPGANLLLSKFGAAMSVVGIGFLVKRTLDAGDALAKLSDRIQIGVTDLMGLRRAADLSGAGAAAMDKGLEFLAKSLGEASQGIGEARQALQLLGLDVGELLRLSPADQFAAIAESTSKLANQSQKAFVATKLFGRAGITLVNTLDMGRAGIEDSVRVLRKWGVHISRLDLKKIEDANDAMGDMGRVINLVVLKAVSSLAPFIEEATKEFVRFATSGGDLGHKVVAAMHDVAGAVGAVIDVIRGVYGAFKLAVAGAKLFGAHTELAAVGARGIFEPGSAHRARVALAKGHEFQAKREAREALEIISSAASGATARAVQKIISDLSTASEKDFGKSLVQDLTSGQREAFRRMLQGRLASVEIIRGSSRFTQGVDRAEAKKQTGLLQQIRDAVKSSQPAAAAAVTSR